MSRFILAEEKQERDIVALRRMAHSCMDVADSVRELGFSYCVFPSPEFVSVSDTLRDIEFRLEDLFYDLQKLSCVIGDLETAKGGEQS